MRHLLMTLLILPLPAFAATDFIAPGNPASVGQNGSVVGTAPDHPVPAPRGAMGTLGLTTPSGTDRAGARLSRADAKRRIEQAGYRRVIDLVEDGSGVWQGRGEKDGKAVPVRCTGSGDVSAP